MEGVRWHALGFFSLSNPISLKNELFVLPPPLKSHLPHLTQKKDVHGLGSISHPMEKTFPSSSFQIDPIQLLGAFPNHFHVWNWSRLRNAFLNWGGKNAERKKDCGYKVSYFPGVLATHSIQTETKQNDVCVSVFKSPYVTSHFK